MLIDCDRCPMARSHCGECVIGVFLELPNGFPDDLDEVEWRAVRALANGGLLRDASAAPVHKGTQSDTKRAIA